MQACTRWSLRNTQIQLWRECYLLQCDPCYCVQGKIIKVKDRAFNDQRYFICDQKLAGLGWTERTSWEEGLKVTIDWYLKNGFSSYWEHGDVEVRLLS